MTNTTALLECGHPPTPQAPDSCTVGYGIDDKGARHCFACCADRDRADMIATGRATLYLVSRPNPSPATVGSDMRARASRHWFVVNWPGSLEFKAFGASVKPRGGGFGSQRTDAYFPGPDGFIWHAINRGDSQVARCRRTREPIKKAPQVRCFLRIDADTLDAAKPYPSMRAAMDAYAATARELDRYGQRCEASLHLATSRDELQEYPDRVLSLTPRGAVKVERT